MNKLTKSQRHKYYKEALQIARKDVTNNVCYCLWVAVGYRIPFTQLTVFTEFYRYKPKGKPVYDVWWPRTKRGQASRIAALKACIAETKPKQTKETKNNKR